MRIDGRQRQRGAAPGYVTAVAIRAAESTWFPHGHIDDEVAPGSYPGNVGEKEAKRKKTTLVVKSFMALALLVASAQGMAQGITGHDSTQPRGANEGILNQAGQDLSPVSDGFRSPAYRAVTHAGAYKEWAGTMMANAMRDPAFFATLSVANADIIRLLNNLYRHPANISNMLTGRARQFETFNDFMEFLGINDEDIEVTAGQLQPEDILPITADLCLRCHGPVGWLEGRSEPKTNRSPFLKGQFWGAPFLENPIWLGYIRYEFGDPRSANLLDESEGEMDGIQCDFCHRATDNFKRISNHDGTEMAYGNGGYFVTRSNPFCGRFRNCVKEEIRPASDFQKQSVFCGTCHDVTNPMIRTRTVVNGEVPEDMPHPMERTYTEWYWSDFRNEKTCQDCHEPMKFLGAQTWMIYPVLYEMWGEVDGKWRTNPYRYEVPERAVLWKKAMERNREFMQREAAEMSFVETSVKGDQATVKVKVVNKTGHKLPTGFAEGRQMWIHIKATDGEDRLVFESGFMEKGSLVRDKYFNGTYIEDPEISMIKIYEQEALASDYDPTVVSPGNEHFHFMLMNKIVKDNRIPPRGYNKAAYAADGAFIMPRHPKDTEYADGQYWDITSYTFTIPEWAKDKIRVTADLMYQTFSKKYIEFLRDNDVEQTEKFGGRSRNMPAGPYAEYQTWGSALHQSWQAANMGPPVTMQAISTEFYFGMSRFAMIGIFLSAAVFVMTGTFGAVHVYRKLKQTSRNYSRCGVKMLVSVD
jgi:hypothetical protein